MSTIFKPTQTVIQGDVDMIHIDKIPQGFIKTGEIKGFQPGKIEEIPDPDLGEKLIFDGCFKIDTFGNIYSCLEQLSKKGVMGFKTNKTNTWKKLNLTVNKYGYLQFGYKKKTIRVHRLVAETFITNPENKKMVRHLNGNKTDNRITNLIWGDNQHNVNDKYLHNTIAHGKNKDINTKINEEIAKKIYDSQLSLQKTADKYSVSKKLVLLIKQKKIWKHIHNFSLSMDLSHERGLILQHGEHSGNFHTLTPTKNSLIELFQDNDGNMIVQVKIAPAVLIHEEHAPLLLEPGIYHKKIETEYDPFAKVIQQVVD